MNIKFYGEVEVFFELLNKKFRSDKQQKKVGNAYRFECVYDNALYKINLFENGTVQIQPQPSEDLFNKIKDTLSEEHNIEMITSDSNNAIFIVHGHDKNSKRELKNILYKWKLTPDAIQDEDNEGKTIIEFLESKITKDSIGIVLLTADDIGYAQKDSEDKKKPRARQNVILELGMLIGKVGRQRCIILRKSEVEIPSDLDGLIYISFDKEVSETKDKLKMKLENMGVTF